MEEAVQEEVVFLVEGVGGGVDGGLVGGFGLGGSGSRYRRGFGGLWALIRWCTGGVEVGMGIP